MGILTVPGNKSWTLQVGGWERNHRPETLRYKWNASGKDPYNVERQKQQPKEYSEPHHQTISFL